ncbi:MAG: RNA polymerase sporulation sigma factor SigK [Clostridia bacterium]|nr:RNA polymerase sporulation sigma factor SigK [Clostridia bacterium]
MFSALAALLSKGFLFFALHIGSGGSFPPALSAAEEAALLERSALGDEAARNALIEHNLRLVAHIVKKYYSAVGDQEDLISIGTIGLIKAVNTFDRSKKTRLATYASRCVENEILMHLRSRKRLSSEISINEPIETDHEGNPLTLMDIISVEDTIADDLDRKIKIGQMREYLKTALDPREKTVLVLRYGLDGSAPCTQNEIARQLRISRSYVSRIEKRALEKLRSRFDEKGKRA